MTETIREIGRIVAGGYYDYQETRLSASNRLRDIIRKRAENIDLSKPEEKKDKEKKSFGKEYEDKNLPKLLEKLKAEGKLTDDEIEYLQKMKDLLKESETLENHYKAFMMDYVETEPIYTQFLEGIKGISGVLASNMIKEFGYCEKSPHISSLWKLCGLHVVNGAAPKKKKGELLDFNPRLRTMCWKISDSFVKQRTKPYRDIYDAEKLRQAALMENKAENAPKSKMHIELRARRKMIKIFLSHYWLNARKLKGLPISEPYAIERLGHTHYVEAMQAV